MREDTLLILDEVQYAGFFLTLGIFAALAVLSFFLKPKPRSNEQQPAGLGDFNFPTATEGRPVPLIWGTVKVNAPNVVWYGDLRPEAITERVKTSLFSSSRVTRGYRYFLGMQQALCIGPVDSMRRIWVNEEELWEGVLDTDDGFIDIDEPDFFGGEELGQGGLVGRVRFYRGTSSQNPNTYLTAFQEINGDHFAYRGYCYLVAEAFLFGTTTRIPPWAIELRRIPNGLGLATPGVNSGADANPMNVLYEILTNTKWGLSQSPADIDTDSFEAAADTLAQEGNGFSFILDSRIEVKDLIRVVEQQIDGVLYIDRTTGKWKITLARGGYDPGDKLLLDKDRVLRVENFTRGSWRDTTNTVLVRFSSRTLDYHETFAHAQDLANVRLQGNRVFSSEVSYPGVKDSSLANNLAWRLLRTLATPLATATLLVDRSLWDHNPGDVVRFSDDKLGISELAMRITEINYGELENGPIRVTLVEDVFVFDQGTFTAPGTTLWTPPSQDVVAIPVGDSLVFEAPKALCDRDIESPGVVDRVWVGARQQGDGAIDFNLISRPGSGAWTAAGNVSGFLVAGELSSSMTAAGAQGSIDLTVEPTQEAIARLAAAMEDGLSNEDLGVNLRNLVRVGQEFFAFRNVEVVGGNLVLTNGYRALMDSAPQSHTAGDTVWIMLGNLTERVFNPTSTQNIKLLPRSRRASLTEPEATAINVTLANRARRPYPPVAMRLSGVLWTTSTALGAVGQGGSGSGLDSRGYSVSYIRRDFRVANEVLAVINESALLSDFPAANTTEYRVVVRNDPDGANTLLFETNWTSTGEVKVSRTKILRETSGVVPTRMRAEVQARHVVDGNTYTSRQNSVWDFDVTTVLGGQFNFGVLAQNAVSAGFTATGTGTHTVNIGTALTTGLVEVRLNGGSWSTVVAAGNTTGTFAATAGDLVELRHTQSGSNAEQTFLELTFSATGVAYAVLTY